jgi:hypothetical protein
VEQTLPYNLIKSSQVTSGVNCLKITDVSGATSVPIIRKPDKMGIEMIPEKLIIYK